MIISNKAYQKIKNNLRVVAKLMLHFNKGDQTIHLWIKNRNMLLTTPPAIAIIKEETGLTDKEILTDL